jgi:hypothetical protein
MDHVVDIESEQGANYTAITFDFAVGNIPYKIGVKRRRTKYTAALYHSNNPGP